LICARAQDPVCKPYAPCYTSVSIVNAASGVPELAPNTLASIYGQNLSYVTRAITSADIAAGVLPRSLEGSGVQVIVGGFYGHLYFVSPGQVNFLVPPNLLPGEVTIQLIREGTAGPAVRVRLKEAAPALFQLDGRTALASHHPDYSLVSDEAPARPGSWVLLWATGLGAVTPPAVYGEIPMRAAYLENLENFHVLLNGTPVPRENIGYAGLAPTWSGLYQINLKIPDLAGPDPEIRIIAGESASPAGLRLPALPWWVISSNRPNSSYVQLFVGYN